MDNFWDVFFYSDNGKTNEKFTIRKNGVRISVLSPWLIRIENQTGSVFCDEPTQCVINRRFCEPEFTTEKDENGSVLIKTSKCTFCFDFGTKKLKYIILEDGKKITDFIEGNLLGTCRTLDGTHGKTKLSNGIISKKGVAVLNDSSSLTVKNNGDILPRKCEESDIYYFAYGHNYQQALKDYFSLTGFPPLIPRFALGNWWSRYKAYTADEYIALMKKFKAKKIPITVATIDMDWHWVKVLDKFGKDVLDPKRNKGALELFYNITNPGWTGYSWNTDLFPDPEGFLKWLKDNNYKITVNLHPASGCKFYEDAYGDFCEFMGIDKNSRQQIFFDITDKKFIEGYFRFLHHPQEKRGVDFWWIDWQQGTKTKIPGLDPLWALNHYHYCDNARSKKRPLILSRFAGAGSQRYPLGFSGDTAQTWDTLAFQPYFTSTASNIGYTWWSHDIGGHHFGERDDELYLRWVQFGVFSPIMRLHSTSNEFMGKEPWKYRGDIEHFSTIALKFRHRLIPYIYSINRLTAKDGLPLIRPLYYLYPEDDRAYNVPNEYLFGTELIVCPITEKANAKTGLAGSKVFLPEGRYTDIFTGRIYKGGTETTIYRDISSIPVLAKEGAIIPLSFNDTDNSVNNPESMEVLVFRGNNSFTLYEDDGESLDYLDGKYCETHFNVSQADNNVTFTINKPEGDKNVIPAKRNYTVSFRDITEAESVCVYINGKKAEFSQEKDGFISVLLKEITAEDTVLIELNDITELKNESLKELKIELVSKLQGSNNGKNRFNRLLEDNNNLTALSELKGPLTELKALYY
ncbi:MAG: DUF5110 domain-containing protein [Oscillospiraceae bacterium]|nr:DUF5110 domain-containing protein [Oscillospiraceae bacterium]